MPLAFLLRNVKDPELITVAVHHESESCPPFPEKDPLIATILLGKARPRVTVTSLLLLAIPPIPITRAIPFVLNAY